MTDRREAEFRKWIQEVAATSRPVQIEDVLNWGSIDVDPLTPGEPEQSEPPFIYELTQESPMTNKRNLYLALLATAAAIVLVVFAVTNGTDANTGIADQVDLPTATTPTVVAADTADVATEFWMALAAGDREQALALVDPAEIDSADIVPFGHAETLEGVFDWYEAVGWKWQLAECTDFNDDQVRCTASARNAWSDALAVEPVSGNFFVRFSEDGIIAVEEDSNSFIVGWSPQVFEKFVQWVKEFHPDDAAIMWAEVDLNQEILDLFELNTARFVEAQQAG